MGGGDAPFGFGSASIRMLELDEWDGTLDHGIFRRIVEALSARGVVVHRAPEKSVADRPAEPAKPAPSDVPNEEEVEIFETRPEDNTLESVYIDVFVAYSRQDTERCEDLILQLRQQNLDVFYDQFIRDGAAWRQSIARNIIGCSVFVVILSAQSIASAEVRNEINLATSHGKRIIPIFVEDITLPGDFELMLSGLNYVYAFEDFDRRFVEAAEEAKTLVAFDAFESRRALAAQNRATPRATPTALSAIPDAPDRSTGVAGLSRLWSGLLLAVSSGVSVSLTLAAVSFGIADRVPALVLFALAFFCLGLPYAILILHCLRRVLFVLRD